MIGYYMVGKEKYKGKNVFLIPGSLAILEDLSDIKISYEPKLLENLNDLLRGSKRIIYGTQIKKINIEDRLVKELSGLVWEGKDDEANDKALEILEIVLG